MKTLGKMAYQMAIGGRTGFCILFLMLACLTACKKELPLTPTDPGNPTVPTPENPSIDPTGKICPIGQATEEPEVSVMLGPAGGTVATEDGRIQLIIPAGALVQEENIRIQSISNTSPAGNGLAFRLEPHGTTFAKPVKLTFEYTDSDLKGTVPEALQVAYQNEKGIWMAMPHTQLNTQQKTVTIETTHFSDWALFSEVVLSPSRKALRPGQKQDLSAVAVLIYAYDLAPLNDRIKEVPLVEVHEARSVEVSKWEVIGGGQLAPLNQNTAVYTAPTSIQKPILATITAQVKSQGNPNQFLLLVSTLMIMPEGITFRIDNGPWIHCAGTAQHLNGPGQGIFVSGGTSASHGGATYRISITTLPFSGTRFIPFVWANTLFSLSIGEPSTQRYTEHYALGQNLVPSPGNMLISSVNYSNSSNSPVQRKIETAGEFHLEKAQLYQLTDARNPLRGTHRIDGYFWCGNP
ncbi:hypothetical protein GCM10027347_10240 [Larkinella harenae]